MVKIRVLPPMPILKDFHRNYRSALLMDNFKLIYRYDKERDEIIIFFIPYYILKGYTSCSSFHDSFFPSLPDYECKSKKIISIRQISKLSLYEIPFSMYQITKHL